MAEHGDSIQNARILELGAGTGYLALKLAQRGAHVITTDREGGQPRLLRNVLRNQSRLNDEDGEQVLDVECHALDWEEEKESEDLPAALRVPVALPRRFRFDLSP